MPKLRKTVNTMDLLSKVHDNFSWMGGVNKRPSTVPCSELYDISLTEHIGQYDVRTIYAEKYLKSLLEVDKGRASVIFCWTHTGLSLFVFRIKTFPAII